MANEVARVDAVESTNVATSVDRAVRTCSEICPFITNARRGQPKGCEYFQRKEVKYGQPCKYDIEMINEFVKAHRNGDLGAVKERVGAVVGSMMVKVYEMLAVITEQGLVNKEPILDAKGMPIYFSDGTMAFRYVEHPLLSKVVSMSKSIGFDLNKFKLTPSTAGENITVQGNIQLSSGMVDIKQLMAENKLAIQDFEKAASLAEVELKNDPVYKEMTKAK